MKHKTDSSLISINFQKRFVLVFLVIFLLEIIGSVILANQYQFLLFSSSIFIVTIIINSVLPILFIVTAYLLSNVKKPRLWRVSQSLVYTIIAMLLYTFLTILTYFYSPTNDNYNTYNLITAYAPAIVAFAIYFVGLTMYRKRIRTQERLVSSANQMIFIVLATLYTAVNIYLDVNSLYLYGDTLLMPSFITFSVAPTILSIALAVIGYCGLKSIKNQLTRIFIAAFAVLVSFTIASVVNILSFVFSGSDWLTVLFTTISYGLAAIIYIVWLYRTRKILAH